MTWVATGTATLTAAEIAAAEAAAVAAATAAAEAAAATAATTAAAETAAATAATEAAATAAPAITEAAATVLPEATSAIAPEIASAAPEATGILEAAPGVAPPPAQPITPAGLEQVAPAGTTPPVEPTGIQTASGPATSDVSAAQTNDQIVNMVQNATPDQMVPNNPLPSGFEPAPTPSTPAPSNAPSYGDFPGSSTDPTAGMSAPTPSTPTPTPEPNPFLQGAKDVGTWMDNNPFKTGALAYAGLEYSGALKPNNASTPTQEKKTFKNQYSLSPDFQGGPYSEPNVYKPKYQTYAAGGITQINGPVERMSANALGGNANMYPQSQQERTNFATPTQMPVSSEMVANNQYSGVTMASGGEVKGYAGGGLADLATQEIKYSNGQYGNFNNMAASTAPKAMTLPYTPSGDFGQGAQGYTGYSSGSTSPSNNFSAPSGGSSGGSGGAMELKGPVGIVQMAAGGVARFANEGEVEERPRRYRGDLMGTLDKYNEMIEGKRSGSVPSGKSDPYTGETGIVTDSDADTRHQDAYTAALTRLKKTGGRANTNIAALPAGVQPGTLSYKTQQAAGGGIMQANLGSYAAGGNPRLLRGPGDGMSDNIPATIGGKQPARLADGEFVVPADVVSHLGNGSTDAGAKRLYAMMDRIQSGRKKTVGKDKVAVNTKSDKHLPA